MARWNFHLYRFNNPASDSESLRPRVELHRLEMREAGRLRPLLLQTGVDLLGLGASGEQVYSYPLSTYKVPGTVKEARICDTAPYYGLTLINDTEYDLFPYVLYFDPSTYAIHVRDLRDFFYVLHIVTRG